MDSCEKININVFADMLSTISQAHRLQIICLLAKKKELCVCDIIDVLQIKQNLVSHHLNILKEI
ncbi:MAG: metalloregulator ArsR/SmtB family transcription factor [bacterium]